MTDTSPHIVCVTGSRTWKKYPPIFWALRLLQSTYNFDTLIHGKASGADTLSHTAAVRLRYKTITPYPADWRKYGTAAGPIRNRRMLTEGKPDLVLAFHDYLEASKGTKDCLAQAAALNIPTLLLTSKATEQDIADALRTTSIFRFTREETIQDA